MNMSLINTLNSVANLLEIQRTNKHAELHHKYAISEAQIFRNSVGKCPGLPNRPN